MDNVGVQFHSKKIGVGHMSERGGARARAGRPRGSANLKTREVADRAAAEGITPLEVFLEDMRFHYARAAVERAKGSNADVSLIAAELVSARDAAKDAAPYMHPRLQAIAHTGNIAMTHEQWLERLAEDDEAA